MLICLYGYGDVFILKDFQERKLKQAMVAANFFAPFYQCVSEAVTGVAAEWLREQF